mmetsp:Transcript_26754/g.100604  ORF Transcript_26754/g.100604 Transcript_26754/m.100604 type:complete len:315 (+) Transcript_26754:1738-2682(+)
MRRPLASSSTSSRPRAPPMRERTPSMRASAARRLPSAASRRTAARKSRPARRPMPVVRSSGMRRARTARTEEAAAAEEARAAASCLQERTSSARRGDILFHSSTATMTADSAGPRQDSPRRLDLRAPLRRRGSRPRARPGEGWGAVSTDRWVRGLGLRCDRLSSLALFRAVTAVASLNRRDSSDAVTAATAPGPARRAPSSGSSRSQVRMVGNTRKAHAPLAEVASHSRKASAPASSSAPAARAPLLARSQMSGTAKPRRLGECARPQRMRTMGVAAKARFWRCGCTRRMKKMPCRARLRRASGLADCRGSRGP